MAAAFIALAPYPQPVRSGSLAAAISMSLLLQRLYTVFEDKEKKDTLSFSHPHPYPHPHPST